MKPYPFSSENHFTVPWAIPSAPTFLFLSLICGGQTHGYALLWPDPLPACVWHSSIKPPSLHARPALLREVGVQERGAVFVDGHRSRLFEGLLGKGAPGEDGDGAYAGVPGGLDIPDSVTDRDGLICGCPCFSQGLLEDVGGGLGVLDVAGVDDAVHAIFGFELLHVVFQLFVLGAGDEPDLIAALFEGGDQLLRPGQGVAVLL